MAWVAVQETKVRANVGANEQGFVDVFNTQMLPLTQSG